MVRIVDIEQVVQPSSGKKFHLSLRDFAPQLVPEWCHAKNCGWGPEHFSKGSEVKAWWTCPDCSNDYKACIKNRANGAGCPYCHGKLVSANKSLEVEYPELSRDWHPSNNNGKSPRDFLPGSSQRVFWLCNVCAFEWNCKICDRALKKSGCPKCYRDRMNETHHDLASRKRSARARKLSGVPLSISDPDVAAQWHPNKNGDWTPSDFTRGANVIAWWKCNRGEDHEWKCSIDKRFRKHQRNTGCPFCAGLRRSVTNSLAAIHPNLSSQFDRKRNRGLDATTLKADSRAKIWWKLPCGHSIKERIQVRLSAPDRCTHCFRKQFPPIHVSRIIPLTQSHPELAVQWHETLNGDKKPDQFSESSTYRAWWRCIKNSAHEFQGQITHRVRSGSACPVCKLAGKSLAKVRPDVASLWHPTRNEHLAPETVFPGSELIVWWQCNQNVLHDHQARIYSKTGRNPTGCPYCAKQKTDGASSLAAKYPNIASELHPTKNGALSALDLRWDTNRKVIWQCLQNRKHEWKGSVKQRTIGNRSCPHCSGYLVNDENRLSIVFPDLASEWHKKKNRWLYPEFEGTFKLHTNRRLNLPANTKNRRIRASDVSFKSTEEVWWQCSASSLHIWKDEIYGRAVGKRGCPFCAGKRIAADNNLEAIFPKVAKSFDATRNAPLIPAEVAPYSNKRAWFKCAKNATHRWQATIASVTTAWVKYKKNGCPYCSHLRVERNASLGALYPRAAEVWDKKLNGSLTVFDVRPFSTKRVFFVCSKWKHHKWSSKVAVFTTSLLKRDNPCKFCHAFDRQMSRR